MLCAYSAPKEFYRNLWKWRNIFHTKNCRKFI